MMQFLDQAVDAFFVSNPTNIRYLTEFEGDKNQHEAFLLVFPDTWYLITSLLYQDEARIIAKKLPHVTVVFTKSDNTLTTILTDIAKKFPISKLGIEPNSLTVFEHQTIQKALPAVQLIHHTQQIEQIRARKNPQEITEIKRACEITMACYEFIQTKVVTGVTETYLAWEIEKFIRDEGATMAFEPIVAFDAHSAIPHHKPTITHLSNRSSTILFDFGAKVTGYCADISRVMSVGTESPEWIKTKAVVQKAYTEIVRYLESIPNPLPSTADTIAKTVIQEFKLPQYPHALGHGIGLDVHELPQIGQANEAPLEEGQVFTIEPAIYIPGKFGIRLEDMLLKTKTGIEFLTKH
jgi:Xaa-Pro aminopeptidase